MLGIAIDGPAGSGKTTLGRWIAEQLNWGYLETGLVYRVAAWVFLNNDTITSIGPWLLKDVKVQPDYPNTGQSAGEITVRDCPVSISALRDRAVDGLVTPVAASPGVREAVTGCCAEVAAAGPCVVVGRDATSMIVPDASLKIVLFAPKRILAQRLGSGGSSRLEQEEVLLPVQVPNPSVVALDTGGLTIEEVRLQIAPHLERFGHCAK
jgi:CMP/dCMP kinase